MQVIIGNILPVLIVILVVCMLIMMGYCFVVKRKMRIIGMELLLQSGNEIEMEGEAELMISSDDVQQHTCRSGPIILATCSGVCNVGQLTTQAAMQVIRRSPGTYRWMKVEKGKPVKQISPTDTIWAIVGCEDRCACKELDRSKIQYEKVVIATDLGIIRDVKAEVRFDQIDRFALKIASTGK